MEGLKGYDEASDIRDDLEPKEICTILQHLRTFGIFYAARLDLDYAMLQKFQAAYKHPEPGDCGPALADNLIRPGGGGCAGFRGCRQRSLEQGLSRCRRSLLHCDRPCCFDWLTSV
ncbi:hypothetical protein [Streptomyces sp. NPDC058394]|uniref:hypothetical protein n=1 Tax=unclassified Streptomyces TaxID=2593676 RepID=UPI00364B3A30